MKIRFYSAIFYIFICILSLQSIHLSEVQAQDYLIKNYNIFLPLVSKTSNNISFNTASIGSPIAIDPSTNNIWVVNPDADSISIIDSQNFTKTAEISVGEEPWSISLSPTRGQAYVVNRGDGTLSFIDTKRLIVDNTIYVGPEPGMVALNTNGSFAYVSITANNQIAVIDTQQLTITTQITVAALPFALAIGSNENNHEPSQELYVTHLLAFPNISSDKTKDGDREAKITQINLSTNQISRVISLTSDIHGFPNLLLGIGMTPERIWIPHVRASPELPNNLTTTIFAAVASVERNYGNEDIHARLLLNDEDIFGSPVNNPIAVAFSPDSKIMYVILGGSNLVEVIDITNATEPKLIKFLSTDKNPRGMAVSQNGHFGYVMNYIGRSVTKFDLISLEIVDEIAVTSETLPAEVARGKELFNTATDPRLSKGSWISCASCHPDGGTDGVTWFFPDGPRQTPALWNAGNTLPWHWSAALDEAQDVEETIEIIQHGIGLAPGEDPAQLGSSNASRASDLDALSTYLKTGIRSPFVGSTEEANFSSVEQGRRLFISHQCAKCHGDTNWTISTLPGLPGTLDGDGNGMVDIVLRDVGTIDPEDLRGSSGFDVPSLLGVRLTAPYLHNGSMPTLEALLHSGHPNPQSGENLLNDEEANALAAFLRTIDSQTEPISIH